MTTFATTAADRFETNTLQDPAAYHARTRQENYTLRQLSEAGGRVDRIRLISYRLGGQRMYDVSYMYGILPDGSLVRLVGGEVLGTPARTFKGHLIEWARREGVFAKGLGLLDEGRWSVHYSAV